MRRATAQARRPRQGTGDRVQWSTSQAGIDLSSPGTLTVDPGTQFVAAAAFSSATNWLVTLGALQANLTIDCGGKYVAIRGGEINLTTDPRADYSKAITARRALLVQNFAAVHIEGLYIHGSWASDGINVSSTVAGNVAQIQNCRIENLRENMYDTGSTVAPITAPGGSQPQFNHPDVIQSYGGPTVLRVDHVYGESDRQFMTVAPMQGAANVPTSYDVRNVHYRQLTHPVFGNQRTYPFFYTKAAPDDGSWPWTFSNIYYDHGAGARAPFEAFFPESDTRWTSQYAASVIEGAPARAIVPPGTVGVGYTSPGYLT